MLKRDSVSQKPVTRMQVVSPRICVTCVGSEILTTLVMKAYSPLKLSRRFGGTFRLHLRIEEQAMQETSNRSYGHDISHPTAVPYSEPDESSSRFYQKILWR
jgi:hypothetical protein